MMPNSTSRDSALRIRSSATDLVAFATISRPWSSGVEVSHGVHHRVLLLGAQLRVHRKGDRLRSGGFAHRQAAGAIAQEPETGLQMERKRVVHSTSDAAGLEVLQELVPPGNPEGILVENVLVGRVYRGGSDRAHRREALGVGHRLGPPRGAPLR